MPSGRAEYCKAREPAAKKRAAVKRAVGGGEAVRFGASPKGEQEMIQELHHFA